MVLELPSEPLVILFPKQKPTLGLADDLFPDSKPVINGKAVGEKTENGGVWKTGSRIPSVDVRNPLPPNNTRSEIGILSRRLNLSPPAPKSQTRREAHHTRPARR